MSKGLPTTQDQEQIDIWNKLKSHPQSPWYEGNKPFAPQFPKKEIKKN